MKETRKATWKRITPFFYLLCICSLCGCIDCCRIKMKANPIFCTYWHDYEDDYGTGTTYLCPLYNVKVQDNGTSSTIDVKFSNRVAMGIWFLPTFTIIND